MIILVSSWEAMPDGVKSVSNPLMMGKGKLYRCLLCSFFCSTLRENLEENRLQTAAVWY